MWIAATSAIASNKAHLEPDHDSRDKTTQLDAEGGAQGSLSLNSFEDNYNINHQWKWQKLFEVCE